MTIGLLLISTHKYKQFVQPLLNDVKKHFLHNHKIEVHLFTDDIDVEADGDARVSVIKDLITSWRFPEITLYRYKIFTSKKYPNCDYLFYLDVDMSIVDTVGDEILEELVCVRHPGFYSFETGAWCDNKESNAYTIPIDRFGYFAGGFQGGEAERYYRIMQRLNRDIDDDEKRNVMAEWQDESHWNRLLSEYDERRVKILNPSYCMVEQQELREQWGIDHLSPKIIALAKDHKAIRE